MSKFIPKTMDSCTECGRSFTGRSDKKFCTDLCRSAFHNRVKQKEREPVNHTNRILMKNRKILEAMVEKSTYETSFEKMVESGFNFSHFTSIEYNRKSGVVCYCYEYAYYFDKRGLLLIRGRNSTEWGNSTK